MINIFTNQNDWRKLTRKMSHVAASCLKSLETDKGSVVLTGSLLYIITKASYTMVIKPDIGATNMA